MIRALPWPWRDVAEVASVEIAVGQAACLLSEPDGLGRRAEEDRQQCLEGKGLVRSAWHVWSKSLSVLCVRADDGRLYDVRILPACQRSMTYDLGCLASYSALSVVREHDLAIRNGIESHCWRCPTLSVSGDEVFDLIGRNASHAGELLGSIASESATAYFVGNEREITVRGVCCSYLRFRGTRVHDQARDYWVRRVGEVVVVHGDRPS